MDVILTYLPSVIAYIIQDYLTVDDMERSRMLLSNKLLRQIAESPISCDEFIRLSHSTSGINKIHAMIKLGWIPLPQEHEFSDTYIVQTYTGLSEQVRFYLLQAKITTYSIHLLTQFVEILAYSEDIYALHYNVKILHLIHDHFDKTIEIWGCHQYHPMLWKAFELRDYSIVKKLQQFIAGFHLVYAYQLSNGDMRIVNLVIAAIFKREGITLLTEFCPNHYANAKLCLNLCLDSDYITPANIGAYIAEIPLELQFSHMFEIIAAHPITKVGTTPQFWLQLAQRAEPGLQPVLRNIAHARLASVYT